MENKITQFVPRPAQQFAQIRAQNMTELKDLALALFRSGYFADVSDASQAFAKIIAGQEFGLSPFAAMTGLYAIKGRMAMYATTIAGQIKKHPNYDYRVREHTNENCEIEFFENGESLGVSAFSLTDAAKAGLSSSDNYKKFPRNMLFSRALTNGARWLVPDVFSGVPVYTPDELDEKIVINDQGEIVALPAGDSSAAMTADKGKPQPKKRPTNAKLKELFAASGLPGTLGAWLDASVAPGWNARIDEITGRKLGLTDEEAIRAEALLSPALPAVAKAMQELTATPVQGFVSADGLTIVDPSGNVLANRVVLADTQVQIVPPQDEPPPSATTTVAPPPQPSPVSSAEDAEPPADFWDYPAENDDAAAAQMAFAQVSGADVGGGYSPPGTDQHKHIMAMFTKRTGRLKEMYPLLKTAEQRRHWFATQVLENPHKASSSSWSYEEYRKIHNRLEMLPPDEGKE